MIKTQLQGDKIIFVDPALSTVRQVISKCFLGLWQIHWFKTIQGNQVWKIIQYYVQRDRYNDIELKK